MFTVKDVKSKGNTDVLKKAVGRINEWTPCWEEDEVFELVAVFEKAIRMEVSRFYQEYLGNPVLAEKLMLLADFYRENMKLLINVISALGNMINRYGLPPTDEIFDFFLKHREAKIVKYYISMFIIRCPQFKKWPSRWDYLISMPKISPKSKSEHNFFLEIKRIIGSGEKIPSPVKEKFVKIFEILEINAVHPVVGGEYRKVIDSLKNP